MHSGWDGAPARRVRCTAGELPYQEGCHIRKVQTCSVDGMALLLVESDALLYDRLDRPAEHAVEPEVTAS